MSVKVLLILDLLGRSAQEYWSSLIPEIIDDPGGLFLKELSGMSRESGTSLDLQIWSRLTEEVLGLGVV